MAEVTTTRENSHLLNASIRSGACVLAFAAADRRVALLVAAATRRHIDPIIQSLARAQNKRLLAKTAEICSSDLWAPNANHRFAFVFCSSAPSKGAKRREQRVIGGSTLYGRRRFCICPSCGVRSTTHKFNLVAVVVASARRSLFCCFRAEGDGGGSNGGGRGGGGGGGGGGAGGGGGGTYSAHQCGGGRFTSVAGKETMRSIGGRAA